MELFSKCEEVRHLSSTARIFVCDHTLQVVVRSRLLEGGLRRITSSDRHIQNTQPKRCNRSSRTDSEPRVFVCHFLDDAFRL
jgi:hypothetical protein